MIVAVIRKEILTYGRYALLAGLVMAAALVWLLYDRRDYGQSVVEDRFLTATMIAFSGAAFAFGLAATLLDRRRGHWAFAVHRPASRWTIYFGKLIGLEIVYAAATAIALAFAAFAAANPRFTHAPFAVSMLLPALFTLASGAVWLVAGTAVAARDARWIGSRLFPCIIAVFVLFASVELVATVGAVALWLTAGAAVLAVSAAAHFAHNGAYDPQPRWAKPATIVFALAGAILVLTAGLNLLAEALRPPMKFVPRTADSELRHEYSVGPDGQPYVFDFGVTEGHAGRLSGFSTVQGVRLNNSDTEWVRERRPDSEEIQAVNPNSRSFNVRVSRDSFLRPNANLLRIGSPGERENWWYVPARRRLEGYRPDGEFFGSIGVDGFHRPGEAAAPFPDGTIDFQTTGSSNNDWNAVIQTATRVFFVNFTQHVIVDAFQTDAAEPICGALSFRSRPLAGGEKAEGPFPGVLQIVTRSAVHVVSLDGGRAQSVPIDPIDMYSRVSVALLNDGGVAVLSDVPRSRDRRLTTLRGGRVERLTLPAFPEPTSDLVPQTASADYVRLLPNIIGMPPAWSAWGWSRAYFAGMMTEAWQRTWFWKSVGTTFVVPMTVGLATAALAVRGRGLSRRATLGWLIAGIAFGPVAALALLCLHSRPRRVPCPACGGKRPIGGDVCPHCAAGWPRPGDPATDVFDPIRPAA